MRLSQKETRQKGCRAQERYRLVALRPEKTNASLQIATPWTAARGSMGYFF